MFFFTRVLGSSFCCVLSSLMPAEPGQGMTMEWYAVEDWRLCQQDKREWKTEEGGRGFISITSGMPRTFLEWHVYGTKLGKSTLILSGLLRRQGEAQAGFGILSVCVFVFALACACVRCFNVCIWLFCLHVWGLRGGVLGFIGCVAASRPATFTCLYFGLSAL